MKLKDASLLGMRILLAVVFIYHGGPKAFDWALATAKFTKMGFPGFLGPIVGIAEVVGGILLISGNKNKLVNAGLGLIITVAILGVQIPGSIKAGKFMTAGLERDLLMLFGHFVLLSFGAGKFKLNLGNNEVLKEQTANV